METIGLKLVKLSESKEQQLTQWQRLFQEAVLLALGEAVAGSAKSPGQVKHLCARLLLRQGLPPRYVDGALLQTYKLLQWRGHSGHEDSKTPAPSEAFLAACVAELVAAGVPAAKARPLAAQSHRQLMESAPRIPLAYPVPLTVHPMDYELEASVGLNNHRLRVRTPGKDWLLLHLEVRPWQVDKLSRVCSYLELQPTDRGQWYAIMNIYKNLRPSEGVVPLVLARERA